MLSVYSVQGHSGSIQTRVVSSYCHKSVCEAENLKSHQVSIMKKFLMVLSIAAALFASQSAWADGRHYNRGYNNWGYNSGFRNGYRNNFNRYGFRNYSRYSPRHYAPYRYRGGGNYFNISYGNFYPNYGFRRHRYYGAGDIVGGIVLGSLISSSIHNYQDSYRPREVERVVYRSGPVRRTTESARVINRSTAAPGGRRLLRDMQGNCFEVGVNANGDEVRTELDPANCNY